MANQLSACVSRKVKNWPFNSDQGIARHGGPKSVASRYSSRR